MRQEFRLPDAGEGLTEAEIVSWRVQPGDVVAINDVLVEIETAKSLVELPSPFAGVVGELLVPEGETVPVGTPIISIIAAVEAAIAGAANPTDPAAVPETRPLLNRAVSEPVAERQSVLVGYGPRVDVVPRKRHLRRPEESSAAASSRSAIPASGAVAGLPRPLAKPPVRRLARELGVDLREVRGTGADGVITRSDLMAAAHSRPAGDPEPGARETRAPIKGVRRATAQAMVASAFTAPHVTEWVQVDVTRSVKLIRRLRKASAFHDVKLSPLAMVAAGLLVAVRRNPEVNATLDDATQEIVTKHYVNLGIATATPRGLLVPVIRDAQRMGLRDLAAAINELAATARAGRTQPQDLDQGTITITNVGVFGIDGGTPILPPGQSAILAVGQIARRPWVHRGQVRARWVTTLALSFDHRVVDGELGSRVLADVAGILADPGVGLS